MIKNILSEPTINNKKSLINNILNDNLKESKINNNLEKPKMNISNKQSTIINDNEKTTLEKPKNKYFE